jgi:hypothetical protein
MTYQAKLIKQCIQSRLRRTGLIDVDDRLLEKMIANNIRRLNSGDQIAVELDGAGGIKSLKKIDGVGSLHTVDERAIIIHYQELERYFNEQQSPSMEF